MSLTTPTVHELMLASGNDYAGGLFKKYFGELALLTSFASRGMTGTKYKTLGVTSLPTGSAFMARGQGYVARGRPQLTLGEYQAARIGSAIMLRKSTQQEYDQELRSAGNPSDLPDLFTLTAWGINYQDLLLVQQQMITGKTNDALGFPGLREICSYTSGNLIAQTDIPQDTSFAKSVLNAGGTTASTASDVYAVRFGEKDCQLRVGGPGAENTSAGPAGFLDLPAPVLQWCVDPDDAAKMDWFWVSANDGYIGLQIGNGSDDYATRLAAGLPQYSVRRAANVTADSGCTCTPTLLDRLSDTFPDGMGPDAFYASRRSGRQYQESLTNNRTVFLGVGDAKATTWHPNAALPTEHNGKPIIMTSAISNTYTINT